MTITVQAGDFCAMPVAPPAGLAIEFGQWLEQTVDKHKLVFPSKYEHTEIWMPQEGTPYGVTYSAYPNGKGVRVLTTPPDQIAGSLWSSAVIPLSDQQRAGIGSWCLSHADVKYSSLDYFALVGHTLGVDTQWLQTYIESTKHLICSQYVDLAYQAGGVQLFNDERWAGYVTPLDLAVLLESMGVVPVGA